MKKQFNKIGLGVLVSLLLVYAGYGYAKTETSTSSATKFTILNNSSDTWDYTPGTPTHIAVTASSCGKEIKGGGSSCSVTLLLGGTVGKPTLTFPFKLKNQSTGKKIAYKFIGCKAGKYWNCAYKPNDIQYSCFSTNYALGVKQPKNAGEILISRDCYKVPNEFNYTFTITKQ